MSAISRQGTNQVEGLSTEQKREMLARLLQKNRRTMRTAPMSYAQQRLWFLDQLAPGSAFYNMPIALRLTMPLDIVALTRSLNEIARRHDTLRTTFAERNGTQVQIIAPTLQLDISLLHLEQAQDPEKEARRLANEEACEPFDLGTGPLVRARLLRLGPDDHIFLLTLHHIIADGWSLGVLFSELSALYEVFRFGKPSPLADLPIQYADYAEWQRKWLEGGVLEEQTGYWCAQLDGLPVLALPSDRCRPAVATFRGARRFFTIAEEIVQPLAALGRREGATLFMTLLAAFEVLLHRYSGQRDFAVGAPIANRTRPEVEGLIGFFVNTLVLRADLSGAPTFRELLRRTRETTLAAYAHQDLPFERLVEELHPQRDAARNPLVQVIFALQNAPIQSRAGAESHMEIWEVERGTANFDLVLDLWERGSELGGRIEYSTELFEADTIERLLGHLKTILIEAAADPDRDVGRLPILTAAERRQILVDRNATARDFPSETPIAHLFEAIAERNPQAPALLFESQQLTYGELNTRANQLAHYLQRQGVGVEDVVGLFMDSSAAMITAMLAVLKAGAAYLPLAITYPAARIAFMLEDAQPKLVLTDAEHEDAAAHAGVRRLSLAREATTIERESTSNPEAGVTAENLAYVMYTSGSSGNPKPISILQRGVTRITCNPDYMDISPQDRFSHASTPSFDAATFEIWGALLNGALIIGIPKETAASPIEFAKEVDRHGITVLFATTALFNRIVRECPELLRLPRHVLFGGEAADASSVREALKEGKPRRLLNMYGPTECTTFATWNLVSHVPADAVTIPIGRPVANTTAYVLDDNLEPVPVGVPGELFLGGPGLARGYRNHPELTAQSFMQTEYGRLYRTGDVVRWRPDGALEFLGRRDEQVKVRGFRVEPKEIQAVLASHSAVRDSVVTIREETPGERSLVAYIVARPYDALDDSSRVQDWNNVYDEMVYSGIGEHAVALRDPRFNTIGWKSTYSGQDIRAAEMREQVDQTVERIASLGAAEILEIGCGTGLLLFRLAEGCKRYWATDFSETALDYVCSNLTGRPEQNSVRLLHQPADHFTGISEERFDAVILNSVIQYFPGIEYLVEVISHALAVLKPGGSLFIGDVRNLALLECFHASVELEQAPAALSIQELRSRIHGRWTHERELAIDPAFFLALRHEFPRVGDVVVRPKRGRHHNELTRYRYDAVVRLGHVGSSGVCRKHGWRDGGWTLDKVKREMPHGRLRDQGGGPVVFERVPNSRTSRDVEALHLIREGGASTVGEVRDRLRQARSTGVDPEQLWALTDDVPFQVEISWAPAYSDGAFDAIFLPGDEAVVPTYSVSARRPWTDYANNPRHGQMYQTLVPRLRQHLELNLPSYMMPAAFVFLDSLPLTPNGKVDLRALPLPVQQRPNLTAGYVAPRNALESVLAGLWAEVLALDQVGVQDGFFELGGHSLLATQLLSRVRDLLGAQIPLRTIFAKPAVKEFAAAIESDPEYGPKLRRAAELLLTVTSLSEEEAAGMLEAHTQEANA